MVENKCPYCDKIISGSNEKQVEYLILQHKLSKHPEKIRIEEDKDGYN